MRQRSLAMRALAGAALLLAAAVVAETAAAKTIRMPEDAPVISFDIPDDWTVTPTPLGMDFAPPDKSALIVSGFIKRDRAALTKWQADATQRMKDFGIAFDTKAKKPIGGHAAAPTTLFSGAPSIGTPEQGPKAPTAFEDKAKAGAPLEELTGRPPPKGAKIPVNGLIIYGASDHGTPVDAELLDYALSSKQLFLMLQESGKTDERIGAIVDTVRRAEK